jgi:chorismate mutase
VAAGPRDVRAGADPVIRELRERISNVDRTIVSSLNRRIELVLQLKRYKEARALPFVEPEREEWIFRDLARFNRGPLSQPELARLVGEILALTKREVARL